ncbi:MAG: PPOX class F420-dependent oxidoreductase [Ilumatobacter sp.]|uniref:PPOX class F420-dependent oxidoreductase n=1 Tax=Ilumatobacter sp. TaxID=1967498 RepID=UPI003299DFBA
MSITDEKYVSLTTYRKDGTPKSLPVWIADFGDGTIGFTTASSSHKVKRIGNDPRVTLQPSNAKGEVTPGSDVVSGTAVIVTDPQEFAACVAFVKKKYGIQYRLITLWGKLAKVVGKGSGTDCAVKITVT